MFVLTENRSNLRTPNIFFSENEMHFRGWKESRKLNRHLAKVVPEKLPDTDMASAIYHFLSPGRLPQLRFFSLLFSADAFLLALSRGASR